MDARIAAAAVLTAVSVLAGCSSSPPSAHDLLSQVPGCAGHLVSTELDARAVTEARCLQSAQGDDIILATFGNSGDEQSWMAEWGASCTTIRGQDWAATVTPGGSSFCGDTASLARLLGGQVVSP